MTDLAVTPSILQPHVLVVDDEANVRSALARSLTLLGYRADGAASGYQALEMLAHAHYDAMVLDLRMPGMDGVEVMQQASRMCPGLIIIVLTGHAGLESAITAVKSGAADYLLKPTRARDIAAVITDALQEHAEKLRRQHLLRVMGQVFDEVRGIEAPGESPPVPTQESHLRAGPVTLDRERGRVVVTGVGDAGSLSAELTSCQAKLLAYMMQRPHAVLSCRELARFALGYDVTVTEIEAQGIVRPHICRLRQKIEPDPADPHLICTLPGRGYLFAP
jgi:DNA-binding response OmpR family regulator